MSDLLVNGPHDLSFGPELRREIASADRIDVLCSFLKWSRLRLVLEELRDFCARRSGASLRVLTTAYMMATEGHALAELSKLGVDVRVSYDTERTRLRAKAWLIHRESGFSTGFVGSSNLSAAAMLDGLKWNVRLSAVDNGGILDKFAATFEQYWRDETFRPYVREEFLASVQRSKRDHLAPYLIVDVDPRPHQREILEDLAAERANGHTRNLVVAATAVAIDDVNVTTADGGKGGDGGGGQDGVNGGSGGGGCSGGSGGKGGSGEKAAAGLAASRSLYSTSLPTSRPSTSSQRKREVPVRAARAAVAPCSAARTTT